MTEYYLAVIATIGVALFTGQWVAVSWLNKQFTSLRNTFYTELKQMGKDVIEKLEYHERHDDNRFEQVDNKFEQLRNDIWELRLHGVNNRSNQELIRAKKS